MAKNKEPSQRQLRVGEEIRHILSTVFLRQEFQIKELHDLSLTITEVDVSPDLRNAIAYTSVLHPDVDEEAVIKILNKNAGVFNRAIAQKLTMKFSPKLKFSGDARLDYAAHIENLLNKANGK